MLRRAAIFLPLTNCAVSFVLSLTLAFVEARNLYPGIARKMKLNGTVRVRIAVSPKGKVKETKVIGGHPILVTAAVEAMKKWEFDPADADTTGFWKLSLTRENSERG